MTARRLLLNPTLRLTLSAEVARRRAGRARVDVTDERAVRFLLSNVLRGGRLSRGDAAVRRQLVADGILVTASDVPRLVVLDPRLREVSRPESGAAAFDTHVVRARGQCALHRGPGLPPGIGPTGIEPFLPKDEILWIFDPGSRMALPYTLSPGLVAAVRGLLTGRTQPDRVRRSAMVALHAVRALDFSAADGAPEWRLQVRLWREELRRYGYAILRGLFTPIFLNGMLEYYHRLETEGYVPSPRGRGEGRPLLHGEPLLDFLGAQLSSVVRQVTRTRVSWTFSYLRVFGPHAILARHRDTAVCRWNVDLVVGGTPVPERRHAWPLWMSGRSGPRPIRLGLGDAVLYRGAHLPHWRRPQAGSHTTMMGCLHYGSPPRRT